MYTLPMHYRRPVARPVRSRCGFTLIELLVALVISGILAIIIIQLLQGQSRFVEMQSAREQVQQNTRGALDLISSELRGVPPGNVTTSEGGGLENAHPSSITVRAPRVWGIVCSVNNTAPKSVDVVVPRGVSYSTLPAGIVADVSTPGTAPAWTAPQSVSSATATVATTCDGTNAIPAGVEVRRVTVASIPQTVAGTQPRQGSTVYLFDRIAYSTATFQNRLWIYRAANGGNAEPFAGPIAEGTPKGLEFLYYDTDASSTSALPTTEALNLAQAQLDQIDLIRVVVDSRSQRKVGEFQSQRDTATIFLRNRS